MNGNIQQILSEMENYAKEKRICIILPDTRIFLKNLCGKIKPENILEVGTAIGYSASLMLFGCDAKITCCEASSPNIVLAKGNFDRLNLTGRVNIVEGDCLKTLPVINEIYGQETFPSAEICGEKFSEKKCPQTAESIKKLLENKSKKFDLIFLDGPKGLYPEILKLLLPLLSERGVFVADNVSFRGMVSGKNKVTEPRFEKTVEALRSFINDLKTDPRLTFELLETGDGLAVAEWKK